MTIGAQEKVRLLRSVPLFSSVDDSTMRLLSHGAIQRSFKRTACIFRKDDPGDALIVIHTGEVKICVTAPEGREVIFNIMHPGDAFGEIALLDKRRRTADAIAATDSELLFVRQADFQKLLRDDMNLALKVIDLLCERLRFASEQVEDLTFHDAATRLAKLLLRLSEPSATQAPLKVTQQDVSDMVGLSREITNRRLNQLARSGAIRLQRGQIHVLSRDVLMRVARVSVV